MIRKRTYQPEYAFELLRLAKADFESGDALVAAKVRPENACFHYQQTVEKSLKAVLVHCNVAFPASHDLNLLSALLPEGHLDCPFSNEFGELGIYGAQRRYEEGPSPATEEDANQAAKMAAAVLGWAKAICKVK